ncbi:MAG: nucleoside recognition domain-containing protein [Alphaproteobacteria bacterium]
MNVVFLVMVIAGLLTAMVRQVRWEGVGTAPMEALSLAVFKAADGAVTLSIGLVGTMALFLGLMKVAEAGGLLAVLARLLRPLLVRLFSDVPANDPAMGAIVMNLSANLLGLGNAATPFGIRAMQHLDRLNPNQGTATNAMVLFLAMNTSSVTILPTTVIAMRTAAGSSDPAVVVTTTLFATVCAAVVAIVAAKGLAKFFPLPSEGGMVPVSPEPGPESLVADDYPLWVSVGAVLAVLALIPVTVVYGRHLSPWIVPGLIGLFLAFGAARGVRVYESFVEGARESFDVALRIIPYLVAVLVAVAMLRSSGALEGLTTFLSALTTPLGLPAEALPMVLLRPLSGSGAYGLLSSMLNDPAVGPDSYLGVLVSTIQGSTETTFYVLSVYFGAVQVRRIRHALVVGLIADAAGVAGAVVICFHLFR